MSKKVKVSCETCGKETDSPVSAPGWISFKCSHSSEISVVSGPSTNGVLMSRREPILEGESVDFAPRNASRNG